jgi:predicted nucleic acid-binding protein
MKRKVLRVYADTSVFGGVFDEEFCEASRTLFQQVRDGRFSLVTSGAVCREIAEAPARVQAFFESVLPLVEVVEVTTAAVELQMAYLRAGIVSPKWAVDALHVALAATTGCSLIVSWNFAHIVHFDKIALYNEVNALRGHAVLGIHSPLEVIGYEDQDF